MKHFQPIKRAAEQEAAHFVASVIEDVAAPIGVKSLTGIGVLVEMRTIEIPETMFVGREMGRHPIQDHSDAALMQSIDQVHEILRRTEPAARCKVAGGLIAPGAV